MSVDLSELPNPEAVERALRPGENLMTWDWDDTVLVAAYERLSEERAEEARRKAAEVEAKKKEVAVIKEKFPVGSYCRALYSGDGCYYEGKVILMNEYTCMMEFVGYKNREEVDLKNLKPSKGKKARKNQTKVANETYAMNLTYASEGREANYVPPYECSTSEGTIENFSNSSSYYTPSEISQTVACAIPPEPPMPPCSVINNPAMSAMLMSWYMAGYYTGIHENQKRGSSSATKSCRNHH